MLIPLSWIRRRSRQPRSQKLSLLNLSFPKKGSTTGLRHSTSVIGGAVVTGVIVVCAAAPGAVVTGAVATGVWFAVDAGTGAVLCESAGGYGEPAPPAALSGWDSSQGTRGSVSMHGN
jgi:hypothetical protein